MRFATACLGLASNLGWLLAPVLWLQGRGVRQRIPRLPEASGARSGTLGDGRLGWLVIGDSTAAGVGAGRQDDALGRRGAEALAGASGHGVRWQAVGSNGRRMADVRRALRAVLPDGSVDVVVVVAGVNDATGWTAGRRFVRELLGLLDEIEARFAGAVVLVSGLPPMHRFPALPVPLRQVLGLRALFLDRLLRETLAARAAQYVPLRFENRPELYSEDGFHPGVKAYAIWADELAGRAAAAGGWATGGTT